MALKDGGGLVKKYAMVNIQKYQNVAIGDTVAECEKAYVKLLAANGISSGTETLTSQTVSGKIKRVAQAVMDGNSHFYVVLENKDLVFDFPVTEYPEIIKYDVGDTLTIEYTEGEPACTVLSLEE